MGYEIAGGLGVKIAAPERGVYVLVGDGSYLMMAQEIATAVQGAVALTIVVFDNQGFASIGGLSESLGSGGIRPLSLCLPPSRGDLRRETPARVLSAIAWGTRACGRPSPKS